MDKRVATLQKNKSNSTTIPLRQPANSSADKHPENHKPRRGARTTNACDQCQRRKTKCSGKPDPCEACNKLGLVCHFDARTGMRSKLKATNSVEDEKVQYLLNAVLNTIKYNDEGSVGELIQTLRQGSSPGEVALRLRQNLTLLQERGAIAKMEVDDSDLFSLASRINTQDELQYLTSEQYINTQDYTVDAFFPTSDDSSGLIGTNPLQSIPHVWTDGDISLPIEIQNTHPLHWSPLISEPTSTLATGVTLGRQNLPKISVNTMLSYAIPSQVCVEATADQTHSIGISSPFTSPLHTVAPWQAQVDAMQEFGDCFDSASTSAQFATVQPQGPVFNQHPLQMHFRNSTDISHSGSAINPTSSLVNTEAGQERRSSEIDICVAQ